VNILPVAFLEDLQVSFCDNGTCHPTETAITQDDNANVLEKIRQELVRCNNRNRARLCWSHAHFSREDATVEDADLFFVLKRIHRTELLSDLGIPFTRDDKYILCLTLKKKGKLPRKCTLSQKKKPLKTHSHNSYLQKI
jgi:hypothetical protein